MALGLAGMELVFSGQPLWCCGFNLWLKWCWNTLNWVPSIAELCQHSRSAKGKLEAERGHEQDSCHTQTIPNKVMLRYKSSGEGGKMGNDHSYGTHNAHRDPAGSSWIPAWLHELVNQFFVWFCFALLKHCALVFLLNCNYLNPSFYFLPQKKGVSKMLGWSLVFGSPSTWMILWYFFVCVSHIYYRCQKALHNAVRKKLLKFWTVPNFLKICLGSFGFFRWKLWQIQYWLISQESHRSTPTSQESIHLSSYLSHQYSLKSERREKQPFGRWSKTEKND